MSYQSLWFPLFVGAALPLYYRARPERRPHALLLLNLIFYALCGLESLPFLAAAAAASYFAARRISRVYRRLDAQLAACAESSQKKPLREMARVRARRALMAGMAAVIGLLVACKYASFLRENLNAALSAVGLGQIPAFETILPLGVSFYSFMALGYMLDVYWRRCPAEENFLRYAAFLSYFPHIAQGPIDRYGEFRSQVEAGARFRYQNLCFGAQRMLWGYFKKLVVADRLGLFVDTAFENWARYDGAVLIAAVAAYSIQIYADFSGCIDIVSGASEIFGIRLRENFRRPYFSRSMGEFWRRWHISLQEWFKDYVYFPASTSSLARRVKKRLRERGRQRAAERFAACFPIVVVWAISGIWHGAAWKFVAWGAFHAALLVGGKLAEDIFARMRRALHIDADGLPWRLWQMLRTFLLCCVGRIFFRAERLSVALAMIPKMLRPFSTLRALAHPPVPYGLSAEGVIAAIVGVLALWAVDLAQERMPLRETLARRSLPLRWALIYACLFAVLFFGVYGPGSGSGGFLYEEF